MRTLLLLMAFMQAEGESPRPDVEYSIFQFPTNRIPRIDGDASDWAIVPDSYAIGTDQLVDTVGKHGDKRDPENLDVSVKVGWSVRFKDESETEIDPLQSKLGLEVQP